MKVGRIFGAGLHLYNIAVGFGLQRCCKERVRTAAAHSYPTSYRNDFLSNNDAHEKPKTPLNGASAAALLVSCTVVGGGCVWAWYGMLYVGSMCVYVSMDGMGWHWDGMGAMRSNRRRHLGWGGVAQVGKGLSYVLYSLVHTSSSRRAG